MGRGRISMKALRKIIELHMNTGFSNRQISEATGASRPVVAQYIDAYTRSGLSWEEFSTLTDTKAIERLTVPREAKDLRYAAALSFFPYMLKELYKVGVTRQMLWDEYKAFHPDGYERSQFCNLFSQWVNASPDVTMTQEHKAGDRMYVDFAGTTRTYREHGIERQAQLFVAILGASQYTYVEALRSQKKEDFLTANRNALLFFGGSPAAIVPDNLKSAVTKADRYEGEVNQEYDDFARHHGTVIFPARPHAPRDKALVEGAVNIMYTRILAPLRDRVFESLEALNQAIGEQLEIHNDTKFQRLPYSRKDLFVSIDMPALKPLPSVRWEYTEFRTASVGFNYHVELYEDHHSYSVPFAYAKQKVTVLVGIRTVEIYFDNARIAFHKRLYSPGYSTLPEHRPENHRFQLEWTPERLISWAGQVSIHTRSMVVALLEKARYPDQAFRSCIGIISLSKKYPIERLDSACHLALDRNVHSYQAVKKLLEDPRNVPVSTNQESPKQLPLHENLRGQAAYQ